MRQKKKTTTTEIIRDYAALDPSQLPLKKLEAVAQFLESPETKSAARAKTAGEAKAIKAGIVTACLIGAGGVVILAATSGTLMAAIATAFCATSALPVIYSAAAGQLRQYNVEKMTEKFKEAIAKTKHATLLKSAVSRHAQAPVILKSRFDGHAAARALKTTRKKSFARYLAPRPRAG